MHCYFPAGAFNREHTACSWKDILTDLKEGGEIHLFSYSDPA